MGKKKSGGQQTRLSSAGIQADNTSVAHHSKKCSSLDHRNMGLDAWFVVSRPENQLNNAAVKMYVELSISPETAACTSLYGKAHKQARDLDSQRQVAWLCKQDLCKDQALQQRMGREEIGEGGGAGNVGPILLLPLCAAHAGTNLHMNSEILHTALEKSKP